MWIAEAMDVPEHRLWDVALLAVAGYIAVVTLVRLMALHRDKLLMRFRPNFD